MDPLLFYLDFLSLLEEEIKSMLDPTKLIPNLPLLDIFDIQYQRIFLCLNCQHQTMLPIDHEFFVNVPVHEHTSESQFIDDIMKQKREKIADYLCKSCLEQCEMQETSQILKLPNVLVAHPVQDPSVKKYWKEFPVKFWCEKSLYELSAITFHSGSQKSGHCIALCRKEVSNWVLIDDSVVKENMRQKDIDTICTRYKPYLLFYEKVSTK